MNSIEDKINWGISGIDPRFYNVAVYLGFDELQEFRNGMLRYGSYPLEEKYMRGDFTARYRGVPIYEVNIKNHFHISITDAL